MRIVSKVSIALAALVGASLLLDLVALRIAVTPSFEAIEDEAGREDHARVKEALGRLQDRVRGNATDYGRWDDTYAFVEGAKPEFLASNVTVQSIRGLDANYIAIVALDGRVLADVGFDFTGTEPAPIRLFDADRLAQSSPFLDPLRRASATSGLLRTSQGLVAIGITPILRSDTTGDAKAILAVGRIVDPDELRATTKVDLVLEPPRSGLGPAELTVRGGDLLTVVSPMAGMTGGPVATLVTSRATTISTTGEEALALALALIFTATLVLGPVFTWFLRRTVTRRIDGLLDHISTITSTGQLVAMPHEERHDELSEVSRVFNAMTVQLTELRERLRKRDYREGAADYAAGVLHNVRNAITPVATISSGLLASGEAPWRTNLARALAELKDESLDPSRAEKLRRFVALTAERLVDEEAVRTKDIATLADMVRHVATSLASYAEASEAERVLELVDLSRAFMHGRLVVESRVGPSIEVLVPDVDHWVIGRQILLNEILANLFLNAADAIAASGRDTGRIAVEVAHATTEGSPTLRVSIADDGDGFDPAIGERLFERGFSTKPGNGRGLGLHWCANSVTAMGGTLRAQSAGPGRGAIFHLTLRLPAAETAAAA